MKALAAFLADIEAEQADLLAHPLSARQAVLVAVLVDKFADRVFFTYRKTAPDIVFGTEDVLAWRDALRQRYVELGLILDLCALPPSGAHLVTKAVKVPFADYSTLSTPDFMVSIYNDNSVQRVVLVSADGSEQLAIEVLAQAIDQARTLGS